MKIGCHMRFLRCGIDNGPAPGHFQTYPAPWQKKKKRETHTVKALAVHSVEGLKIWRGVTRMCTS
jgi:hypothetical protein